ncbi:MAG: hypothetical protein JNM88_16860, partial [Chitinophagaceae bacterium]|nr:hypothetical protein [Chitinophagaceae bacterium]
EATKAGTLKKVIYPTGGYEEFTYEPHTIVQNLSTETYSGSYNISVTGGGTGNGPHGACDQTTNTHPFSLTHPQLKLNFVTEWNPGGPPPGDPNACNADGIHFLSYFEIWDMITNQRVFEARHKYYQGNEYVIQLEPGVPYEARLKANGLSTHAYVNFQFNPVVQTSFTNIPVCGLRVKKIDAFDPLTNQTITRYYKYASLQTPDRSSGVGVLRPSFESVYRRGGICYNLPPPTIGAAIAECANIFLQVSASAVSGAYSFNGSPIAYTHVIETTDEQMTNGGIEHKFYAVNNPHMPGPVLGYEVAGTANTSAVPDMNGTELETKVFKKQGSAFITLKHTQNNYVWDNRVGGSKVNYAIRKRWDPPPYNPVTFSAYDRVRGYDVNSYLHLYRWWYLATSTTTEYDQNGTNPVVKTVNYTYGNTAHLQPTQVTTTGSNNETITQVMKYPHDFAGAMYTAMISKNIITPVIESTTTNGADPVSAVKNEYSTWTVGSNTFYKPQTVKVSSGNNPPEDRLRYYSYDNGGNPLELSKEGDNHIAYIWNYKKTYPVAEVKNAAYNEIAYTSFEGDEYGRWTLVSGTPVGGGITGKMYLSGSLSLTLTNTAKAYVVTLWTKSDVSVNGSSGTLLMTKGAWSLYRWNISAGTGSVSVQGAEMDEVRLYPAGAQMTTYTYGPYVGLSSACDVNNLISYYYYDGFNRLTLIKDIDNNILKKVCYNYAGQAEDCNAEPGTNICTNTAANWQNLPDTRCQKDPATGLNTGHLEQLRHDINTCSPTYGLAEWYDLGMNTEACPMTENVSLTSTNYVGYTGFTAVYTSIGTGAVY